MIPARLTTAELCDLWNVTKPRITQLAQAGKIHRGEDGKFDRDECMAYRKWALKDHQVETLFQTYGNAHGTYAPKIVDVLIEEAASDDECLGLAPAATVETPRGAVAEAVRQTSRLTELRAQALESQLERQRVKHLREDGELIERKHAYQAGLTAAAEIKMMLGTLEYEVAALFPDPEIRKEVRRKVEQQVDKCLFALNKKFAALAKEEAENVIL